MNEIWFLEYSRSRERKEIFPFHIIEMKEMLSRNCRMAKPDNILDYDWNPVIMFHNAQEAMQCLAELKNANGDINNILRKGK
jgi:hypothetical protein